MHFILIELDFSEKVIEMLTFYDLLFFFSSYFQRIFSWRYVYCIWCRWHYVPQQRCLMNHEKHQFDRLRPLLVHLHTWTHWTLCNQVRIMVANNRPLNNKVAPDTLHIIVFKHPNIHRSLNRIMHFIHSQQLQPVAISYQLTHKVFLRLLLGQVK